MTPVLTAIEFSSDIFSKGHSSCDEKSCAAIILQNDFDDYPSVTAPIIFCGLVKNGPPSLYFIVL